MTQQALSLNKRWSVNSRGYENGLEGTNATIILELKSQQQLESHFRIVQ